MNRELVKAFNAGGAIASNTLVKFGADNDTVVAAAAAADFVIGAVGLVAVPGLGAVTGDRVDVQLEGDGGRKVEIDCFVPRGAVDVLGKRRGKGEPVGRGDDRRRLQLEAPAQLLTAGTQPQQQRGQADEGQHHAGGVGQSVGGVAAAVAAMGGKTQHLQ
jgi:hypothetical protein